MNRNLIKEQICDVCHKMWQLGWVAANDGNVSARLEDGTFLCTPTGMSKSFITPEKLLCINSKGEVLEGAEGLRPSSEIKMHLRCYEKRPDVWSVIHAHPPGATGFAVAHKAMDMYNMIEDVAVIGVDNVSMSAMVEPPLSTITQHLYDMGMEAAKSLIRQIEYKDKYGELPKPQRMIMNSDLIVRRSTK